MTTARIWLSLAALVMGIIFEPSIGGSLALASLGAVVMSRRRHRAQALVGLSLLCFGLGSLSSNIRARPSALEEWARFVPRCSIEGRILEHAGGLGTAAAVSAISCSGHGAVHDAGTVMLDGSVGDAGGGIVGDGWLIPLGDDGFDQARRLLGGRAGFDPVELTVEPPSPGPHAIAAAIRGSLDRSARALPIDRAAVVEGLAVGDTSGFDVETTELFRRAGLAHLLAVSGSNVAIVLAAAAAAARTFGMYGRVIVGAAVLALYVLVVGPDPSVLRASAMGAVALMAIVGGRRSDPLHALGLALIAVVAFRPAMVFSAGLHLSAAATAGIVLWTGWLAKRLSRLPRPAALGLAATLAAQAAVAPILVGTFGELSLVAPIANIAALPVVPPVTILGLAAGLAGMAHEGLGVALVRLSEPPAAWILGIARTLGALPWAAIDVPRWWGIALAVPVVVAAVFALYPAGRLSSMGDWHWIPYDANDKPMEATQSFSTREEAESWMGAEWSRLLEEGAEKVLLVGDGKEHYKMGLRAE